MVQNKKSRSKLVRNRFEPPSDYFNATNPDPSKGDIPLSKVKIQSTTADGRKPTTETPQSDIIHWCPLCFQILRCKGDWARHRKNKHSNLGTFFGCVPCAAKHEIHFERTLPNVIGHSETHFAEFPLICPYESPSGALCGQRFTLPKDLDQHRKEAHHHTSNPYFYTVDPARQSHRRLAAHHSPEEFPGLYREFEDICPPSLLPAADDDPIIPGIEMVMSPTCIPYYRLTINDRAQLQDPKLHRKVLKIQQKLKHEECIKELLKIEKEVANTFPPSDTTPTDIDSQSTPSGPLPPSPLPRASSPGLPLPMTAGPPPPVASPTNNALGFYNPHTHHYYAPPSASDSDAISSLSPLDFTPYTYPPILPNYPPTQPPSIALGSYPRIHAGRNRRAPSPALEPEYPRNQLRLPPLSSILPPSLVDRSRPNPSHRYRYSPYGYAGLSLRGSPSSPSSSSSLGSHHDYRPFGFGNYQDHSPPYSTYGTYTSPVYQADSSMEAGPSSSRLPTSYDRYSS